MPVYYLTAIILNILNTSVYNNVFAFAHIANVAAVG